MARDANFAAFTALLSATTRELTKLDGKAQTCFLLCLHPGMRAAVVPLVASQDVECLYCQKCESCYKTPISFCSLVEIIR
jgi:hypothetical protein